MALTRDMVFWNAFSTLTQKSVDAAACLRQMLEEPSRGEELAKQVKTIEHEADDITHDVVLTLHQTWITPLDREEIHALATGLDDVLDFIDAAADKFALYEIRQTLPEALELQQILEASVADIAQVVEGLRKIVSAQDLLALCHSINRHEHDADGVYRRALAGLFKNGTEPLELMKWRDVLDAMETATDRAEDVANIIEGIILEHS